jgi:hypothetical protein
VRSNSRRVGDSPTRVEGKPFAVGFSRGSGLKQPASGAGAARLEEALPDAQGEVVAVARVRAGAQAGQLAR